MILFQMNNSITDIPAHEPHATLLARMEVEAAEHPRRYGTRIVALALFGHGCIVVAWLALLGGAIWLARQIGGAPLLTAGSLLTLAVLPGAALWLGYSMLYIAPRPPQGIRVTRGEVPELFALLDKVRRKLKLHVRIRYVLLTDQFNAALYSQPRWGMFGPRRHYLLLGLPLLQGLSVKQFAAVVAHEFGHLSGTGGGSSRWIYSQREYWSQLHARLQDGYPWLQQWLAGFVSRFAPYFEACSRPLARQHEFDADQAAARVAGKEACADALILVRLKLRFLLEDYWPKLMRKAEQQPQPDIAPYSNLRTAFAAGMAEAPCEIWLQQALAEQTGSHASHPSLRERLEHIGAFPQLPKPASKCAGQVLLCNRLGVLQGKLDDAWRARILPEWQQRHRQRQAARDKLAQLNRQVVSGSIELDDAYRRAHLIEELESPAAARALYLEILAQHPEHAPTCFAAGRLLLADDNEQGLALLETAMRLDQKAIIPSCRLAYEFLQRQGRSREAENYYQTACERAALEDRALAERVSVSVSDTLLAHDLRPAQLARLQAQLANHPSIRRAWLTCKQVQYFADRSLYVLLVERRLWPLHSAADDAQFARQLVDTLEMPGQSFVQVIDARTRELKKRARQLSNAAIYPAA